MRDAFFYKSRSILSDLEWYDRELSREGLDLSEDKIKALREMYAHIHRHVESIQSKMGKTFVAEFPNVEV